MMDIHTVFKSAMTSWGSCEWVCLYARRHSKLVIRSYRLVLCYGKYRYNLRTESF